jgi:type VI secretion system VgrG family protein
VTDAVSYALAIDGFDDGHFRVHSFTGREVLSEPYAFDIVVTAASEAGEDVERLSLAQRGIFSWNLGGAVRAFYGVVARARHQGDHESHHATQYAIQIVPRLWLLNHRRRTRIFQNRRVGEIIYAVLREAGIGCRWRLLRDYPVREYCTQYEESDLAFIARLCAESGIYFYFPQGPLLDGAAAAGTLIPGDTVIFGDDASRYPPIGADDPAAPAGDPSTTGEAPKLTFLANHDATVTHTDKVLRLTAEASVRPTAATFRDYDPTRPQARLVSADTSTHPFPASDAAGPLGLEVYDHHGPFLFPKWEFARDEAALMLRQERRRALTTQGESGCPDLCPAHRFALTDYPSDHLDRAYAVVSVEHHGQIHPQEGAEWRVYRNTFECVPAEVTYVPPRPRRESVQVSLTATVAGPPGEEIYVDAMGQIKVQFHWDREGAPSETSSCWIRCMQALGGAGWGAQFIPRVGMEVVVVFDGGDPDKPMVIGALYNGTHPPPFALPGEKTRSGWRTQSSPRGAGFNELSFEDAAAREQIYVHAQRDLDEVVERNHTLLARGDERLRVLGSRVDIVETDVIARVGHNVEEHVDGNRTTQVEGNRIDVVAGNADERVSGVLVTRIEGKERRDVQKNADLEYAEDLTVRVKGCMTTIVGKHDKQRSWVTHAEGTAKLSSLASTEVSSEGELVLRVGKSSIRITDDKIEIISGAVTARGKGGGLSADEAGLKLSSKGDAQILVEKKLVLKSKGGASLSMAKEVKVDGEQILLNSPDEAKDPPVKEPDPPTKIELKDQDGAAVAHQRFLIKLDDKSEVSGMTDKDGRAELDLACGGKVVFPDVTMPGDQTKMELKPHVIRQGEYFTRLAFVHGFDAGEVWNDPKNAEVKAKRKSPNILHPGDVVHLPKAKRKGLPVVKGTANPYTVKVPKTKVRLGFKTDDGPRANEPYVVDGLGEHEEGTTDGDGMLTIHVPVHLREVQVTFPKQNVCYPVRLGDMDPIDEPSGVRKRLEHLGFQFPASEEDAEADVDARDAKAITAFQRARGLTLTGKADDATKAAIMKDHGS